MNKDTMNKELMACLVWAGGMALGVSATPARTGLGYIDGDIGHTVGHRRYRALMAWYGNRDAQGHGPGSNCRMPARPGGSRSPILLSGPVYAGLWAFAPIPVAITAGSERGRGRIAG